MTVHNVYNKVFSVLFANKKDAEKFLADNMTTASNFMQISEITVVGESDELLEERQKVALLKSDLEKAEAVLEKIKFIESKYISSNPIETTMYFKLISDVLKDLRSK